MHIMCPRPFDGITELIEKLKKKSILIALVTGKGEKSCTITLRQFNMDTCFDKVKTGNPFKIIKQRILGNCLQIISYNRMK